MTVYTTLNAIRARHPCKCGWEKLLAYLGKAQADDEPLALTTILKSNGVADAIWCLRALPEEMENKVRLFNADVAELALPVWIECYLGDDRPVKAIQAARDCANGLIGTNDMAAASAAARDAARAAAMDVASATARDAAKAAASAAAWAASWSAARGAAWAAARSTARDTLRACAIAAGNVQKPLFIKHFG